jgi:hypothetical protein
MEHQPDSLANYDPVAVLDAWDAVRERRIIDAEPIGAWAAYRARWAAAPLHVCLIAIFLGGFVLPWTILIGGLILLAVWNAIFGPSR